MKKKTKKILTSGFVLLFAVITFATSLYIYKPQTEKASADTMSFETQVLAKTSALRVSDTAITVFSEEETPPTSPQQRKLYDADGKEIRLIRETGQLITEDGKLLYNPDNLAMGLYNEITQELYDAANKSLSYWYNSVTMQYDVGSEGGKTLTTVKLGDTIYIATILDRKDNLVKTLYVKREKYETNWWDRLNPFSPQPSHVYKYFDMLGREIPEDWFIGNSNAVWLVSAARTCVMLGLTLIHPITGLIVSAASWLYGVFVGYPPICTVDLIKAGTVGEVIELMQIISHPWEKIEGVLTANDYGEYKSGIYINPANEQLCDSLGRPIYQLDTGLPIVYDQENCNIITLPNKEVQIISNGILENCATVEFLRKLSFDVYFNFIDDPEFGIINTIVLRNGDKWYLPNGDETEGLVRDGVTVNKDGEKFSIASLYNQTLGRLFGNTFSGFLDIILLILFALSIIICLPLIIQILKFIVIMIISTIKSIVKLLGGKK